MGKKRNRRLVAAWYVATRNGDRYYGSVVLDWPRPIRDADDVSALSDAARDIVDGGMDKFLLLNWKRLEP